MNIIQYNTIVPADDEGKLPPTSESTRHCTPIQAGMAWCTCGAWGNSSSRSKRRRERAGHGGGRGRINLGDHGHGQGELSNVFSKGFLSPQVRFDTTEQVSIRRRRR